MRQRCIISAAQVTEALKELNMESTEEVTMPPFEKIVSEIWYRKEGQTYSINNYQLHQGQWTLSPFIECYLLNVDMDVLCAFLTKVSKLTQKILHMQEQRKKSDKMQTVESPIADFVISCYGYPDLGFTDGGVIRWVVIDSWIQLSADVLKGIRVEWEMLKHLKRLIRSENWLKNCLLICLYNGILLQPNIMLHFNN